MKHLILQKIPKYDGYQRMLASMVYTFLNKNSASLTDKYAAGIGVANNQVKQNLQIAEESHKPIIRNFKKKNSLFRISR